MNEESSKREISEAMYRYCRSLDRMDKDLMGTVFHPEATVRYPFFKGSWQGFVDWVWARHRTYDIHSHQMSNILVEPDIDSNLAVSESYVLAYLWKGGSNADINEKPTGAGLPVEATEGVQVGVWARYLDHWSSRDGRWAIDHRTCIVDFSTHSSTTGWLGEGRRDHEDPSYREIPMFLGEGSQR